MLPRIRYHIESKYLENNTKTSLQTIASEMKKWLSGRFCQVLLDGFNVLEVGFSQCLSVIYEDNGLKIEKHFYPIVNLYYSENSEKERGNLSIYTIEKLEPTPKLNNEEIIDDLKDYNKHLKYLLHEEKKDSELRENECLEKIQEWENKYKTLEEKYKTLEFENEKNRGEKGYWKQQYDYIDIHYIQVLKLQIEEKNKEIQNLKDSHLNEMKLSINLVKKFLEENRCLNCGMPLEKESDKKFDYKDWCNRRDKFLSSYCMGKPQDKIVYYCRDEEYWVIYKYIIKKILTLMEIEGVEKIRKDIKLLGVKIILSQNKHGFDIKWWD